MATCLVDILYDKMRSMHKALLHTEVWSLSQGKHLYDHFSCQLNHCFIRGAPFLLKRMIERQSMVIHTWILGKHFLESKWSATVTLRKTTVFVANNICTFKWNSISIYNLENVCVTVILTASQQLNIFLMRLVILAKLIC